MEDAAPAGGCACGPHTDSTQHHSKQFLIRCCACLVCVGRSAPRRPPNAAADARYSEYDADALPLDRPPPPRGYIVCRERENTVNGFGRVCLQLRLEG